MVKWIAFLIFWLKVGIICIIFYVFSWGTFRLLGDLWETNFIQKVPLGDFGPL